MTDETRDPAEVLREVLGDGAERMQNPRWVDGQIWAERWVDEAGQAFTACIPASIAEITRRLKPGYAALAAAVPERGGLMADLAANERETELRGLDPRAA